MTTVGRTREMRSNLTQPSNLDQAGSNHSSDSSCLLCVEELDRDLRSLRPGGRQDVDIPENKAMIIDFQQTQSFKACACCKKKTKYIIRPGCKCVDLEVAFNCSLVFPALFPLTALHCKMTIMPRMILKMTIESTWLSRSSLPLPPAPLPVSLSYSS